MRFLVQKRHDYAIPKQRKIFFIKTFALSLTLLRKLL